MRKQTTFKKITTYLSLFAFTAILMGFMTSAQADVSQVKVVTVSKDGSPIAVFYNQGNSWVEIGVRSDGSVMPYNETNRDQFSIYLTRQGVSLQLDLHQNTVNYEDSNGQVIAGLYQVVAYHN